MDSVCSTLGRGRASKSWDQLQNQEKTNEKFLLGMMIQCSGDNENKLTIVIVFMGFFICSQYVGCINVSLT